jgi:hypothetical protein
MSLRAACWTVAHIAVQRTLGSRAASRVCTGSPFPRVGVMTGAAIGASDVHVYQAGLR